MIALPARLPMIQLSQDQVAACEPDWLLRTLQNATKGTSIPEWLANDVLRGVLFYLQENFDGSVIGVNELFDRLRRSLQSVGLKEVAENLPTTPPPVRISLTDLARRAGTGYELAFFSLLEDQVRQAAHGGAQKLHCYGLRKCVKQLAARQRWNRRCERLQTEIMRFLQDQFSRLSTTQPELALAIN